MSLIFQVSPRVVVIVLIVVCLLLELFVPLVYSNLCHVFGLSHCKPGQIDKIGYLELYNLQRGVYRHISDNCGCIGNMDAYSGPCYYTHSTFALVHVY